ETVIKDQSRIGCLVRFYMARALAEDDAWGRIRSIEHIAAARHERRFDHHWRPGWMQLLQQSCDASHMWRRHRCATLEVEVQVVLCGRVGDRRKNILARRHHIRFQQVTCASRLWTTRRERRS